MKNGIEIHLSALISCWSNDGCTHNVEEIKVRGDFGIRYIVTFYEI